MSKKKVQLAKTLKVNNSTISALMHTGINKEENSNDTVVNEENDIIVNEDNIITLQETAENSPQIIEEDKLSSDNEKVPVKDNIASISNNANYKRILKLRKSDKEQDDEIKKIIYQYATDSQTKTILDSNGKVAKIEYIDIEQNTKLLGEVQDILVNLIQKRKISQNEKQTLYTQLMIDYISDRLKFIAITELINHSTPKYIRECMETLFESCPDIQEELKNEFIDETMKLVTEDIENSLDRKTFHIKTLPAEALKLYCRTADIKVYDALAKFIIDGLSQNEIGKNCISMTKTMLYEKGTLKKDDITKDSKIFKKYDL